MDSKIYVPSAILGIALIICYIIRTVRNKQEVQVEPILIILFSASGIIAGGYLIFSTFDEELRKQLANFNIYILAGGVAVIVISFNTIKRYFK